MNYGANLLLENKEGKTAFLIAYQNGNVEMANLLQGKPERINHTEINKSLQLNDTAQISTLVQSDKNSKNLMDVLVKQDSASARLIAPLVDFVDYKDLNNSTLLMVASKNGYGYAKVCDILIEKGANLDLQDNSGTTALMYASLVTNIEVVTLLITKGANVYLKNNDGKTAYTIAWENGNNTIAQILYRKISSEDQSNIKAIERATKREKNGKVMNVLIWTCLGGAAISYGFGRGFSEGGTAESEELSLKAYRIGYGFSIAGIALEILDLISEINYKRYSYTNNYKIIFDKAFLYANSYSAGIGLKFNF